MPSPFAVAENKRIVKSELVPPEGAEATGEVVRWGGFKKIVYREKVEQSHLEPVKRADGSVWQKANASGQPIDAVHTRRVADPPIEREFILDDLGNGLVKCVYNFRGDPEEAKRKALADKRQGMLDRLLDAAVERDIDPEALLAAIEAEPEAGFPKKHGARWKLSDGSTVAGKRADAEAAEAALKG